MRSLEVALAVVNHEESGARVELHAALQRAKEGTQKPLQRSSTTPDTRMAEARLKVVNLEKAHWRAPMEWVEDVKKALVKAKGAAN